MKRLTGLLGAGRVAARPSVRWSGPHTSPANADGLSAGWQMVVVSLVLLALFSRCPSLLTHAQFYAEDGKVWFAQAYAGGWLHSLCLPEGGYLNTAQRLSASLALLFPLRWAPLVMAIAGLLAQVLPVPILLSARCRQWASLPVRCGLAALYIALPAKEIHIVATNMQWHLALAAALLAFSCSPQTWRGRLVDCFALTISVLSGPFCIVLAPLTFAFWWFRRQAWTLAAAALLSIGALIQCAFLFKTGPRSEAALGATWPIFLRMLGGDVFSFAIVGGSSFAWRAPMTAIVMATLLGAGICLYCWRFASLEWKLFLLYCAGLLAGALHSPLAKGAEPAWASLVMAVAARYWFFPALAFAWAVVWCAVYGRMRIVRVAGVAMLLCMSVGVVRDWQYLAFPDEHFAVSVARMQKARAGERVTIPILPEGWSMDLVKRGDERTGTADSSN